MLTGGPIKLSSTYVSVALKRKCDDTVTSCHISNTKIMLTEALILYIELTFPFILLKQHNCGNEHVSSRHNIAFQHPVELGCSFLHLSPTINQFYSTSPLITKARLHVSAHLVILRQLFFSLNCHIVLLQLKYINAIHHVVHSTNQSCFRHPMKGDGF